MARSRPSIFGFLSASPRARMLRSIDLGFGRSAAIWSNDRDRIAYERPDGHTVSLYLEGGRGTRRVDGPSMNGWPGALCFMPHGRCSDWEITAPFRFVHLYLPADELARVFAQAFDRDARLMNLPEITFGEAPLPAAALRRMAEATHAGDALSAETAMAEAMVHLLADQRHGGVRRPAIRGGLAPHLKRRIADHLDAHLGGTVRLRDLAVVAQLSEFHLQRMFRASHGVSPQVWLTHRRVERAKAMLRGREPIAAIALACGFSGQSHLTRVFRSATGVTPAAYRQMV